MRPLLIAFAVLAATLAAAAPAGAVEVVIQAPDAGVRYGERTTITGRLSELDQPLPGQVVRLEVRRYPFEGEWTPEANATTAADGTFAFTPELDRNHDVRVVEETTGTASAPARAYVYPARLLTYVELRPGVIRLRQRYSVPADVRLRRLTRFYVGPRGAKTAIQRGQAPTRRVRPGAFTAVATIELPDRFEGRFRYASCFAYSPGSGMGDPDVTCPSRYRF